MTNENGQDTTKQNQSAANHATIADKMHPKNTMSTHLNVPASREGVDPKKAEREKTHKDVMEKYNGGGK